MIEETSLSSLFAFPDLSKSSESIGPGIKSSVRACRALSSPIHREKVRQQGNIGKGQDPPTLLVHVFLRQRRCESWIDASPSKCREPVGKLVPFANPGVIRASCGANQGFPAQLTRHRLPMLVIDLVDVFFPPSLQRGRNVCLQERALSLARVDDECEPRREALTSTQRSQSV